MLGRGLSAHKRQLKRLAERQRCPSSEQLPPLRTNLPELVVRQNAGARQPVLSVVDRSARIEISRRPFHSSGALTIQEPDYQLRRERVKRQRPPRPRRTEIGKIPTLRHETIEPPVPAEHGLYGIMSQIMEGEEAALLTVLTLPSDRSVSPFAA